MNAAETPKEAYDRGIEAGRIEARLDEYAKHFAAINGSVADTARELHLLVLAVQRLEQQAVARDATVVTTAKALKEAEEARRDKSTQSWSPFARLMAGLGGLAALATVLAVYLALRK
jgi:hypothetical protein